MPSKGTYGHAIYYKKCVFHLISNAAKRFLFYDVDYSYNVQKVTDKKGIKRMVQSFVFNTKECIERIILGSNYISYQDALISSGLESLL